MSKSVVWQKVPKGQGHWFLYSLLDGALLGKGGLRPGPPLQVRNNACLCKPGKAEKHSGEDHQQRLLVRHWLRRGHTRASGRREQA